MLRFLIENRNQQFGSNKTKIDTFADRLEFQFTPTQNYEIIN